SWRRTSTCDATRNIRAGSRRNAHNARPTKMVTTSQQRKFWPSEPRSSRTLGGLPHMGLQAQTAEKLAEGFGSHASFAAEHKERGHKQADEPGAACLRFPQRRLPGAVPAIHGLEVAMYAAFGKPGAIRQAPDALLAVCTNRVENDNTPDSSDL